jgi:alkanesulfonate monooxygenase SsuD/methylene tetrahydromethanopterin reductase-like flavin-dependent oxidoreductase (luciferase family)
MRFGTFSYNQARPWVSEKQAFEELLEQILLTERLGFDEAWFAEHHHSDYGLIASPNLMIASLAYRTKRLRLGNLVNVLPLYDPMRLAEECGMLDILTGGRLNVGLGRGVPRDDLKHGLDRETAQARFEEGIEIMMRSSAASAPADLLRRYFARQPCDGGQTRLEPGALAPTTRQLRPGDPILSGGTCQTQKFIRQWRCHHGPGYLRRRNRRRGVARSGAATRSFLAAGDR